jgi:DNA-binding CsgD family transcriptional regulator/tetratricopeptide (TPR) repeat protein
MGVRRSSPILIGRERELRALEEAVAARAERPVVLLGGEAGVGKSRLVGELATRATAGGATVTVGSCMELGADLLPYAPFVESLGRFIEGSGEAADGLIGTARSDLAPLLPDLEPRGQESRDVAGSRGRMYEAVRGLLDRAPEPLVLVLEDVHWADQSTLELLSYLARRLRHGRTALVATYRTDELHRRHPLLPVLAELQRGGRATRIQLGRLDRAEVAGLVREIRGEAAPDSLVETIAGRSEGNPFLVEELLAADAGPATSLPATLRDLLLARVGTIKASTRKALGIVAAAGRPVDAELVEAAWDGSTADLDNALRDGVERALLVVEPAGRKLGFRHALLAEAIHDDLLPGERVRLHARLARILAERPHLASLTEAGAAAELAYHLLAARDLPAALEATVRAADAAAAGRAYPEAQGLYERALELCERAPEADGRSAIDHVRLLDRAAEASFHAGDVIRAMALGRLAVDESAGAADPSRTGLLLVRLLEWTEETGHAAELDALANRALALVPADRPTAERAFALLGLSSARMHAGRNREASGAARESAIIAAACGAVGFEAIARSVMAITLVGLCRDEEAITEGERAVALAEVSRGTEEVVIAHVNRVAVYRYLGRFERAAEVLGEARLAVDREGSLTLNEPLLATVDAAVLAWEGRWTEADGLVSSYIDAGESPFNQAVSLCLRGTIHVRRGRLEDGERDLRAALRLRPSIFVETAAEALSALAEAALARANPGAALALVEEGLGVLEPTDDLPWRAHLSALGLRASADLAERSQARREPQLAVVASSAANEHLERLRAALDGRLVEDGGVDDLLRAKAAWGFAEASRGFGDPGPELWAAAAPALFSVGESHLAAYCRYRGAEAALHGPGDRARAERSLRESRAWAAMVGAEPLRRDVDGLARRARLDVTSVEAVPGAFPASGVRRPRQGPASAAGDPYGLSPREREVLALLVDGRTNREIGASLFISEKTASVHVTHILDKLGVTSRGAAAALAARGGFLDAPGD